MIHDPLSPWRHQGDQLWSISEYPHHKNKPHELSSLPVHGQWSEKTVCSCRKDNSFCPLDNLHPFKARSGFANLKREHKSMSGDNAHLTKSLIGQINTSIANTASADPRKPLLMITQHATRAKLLMTKFVQQPWPYSYCRKWSNIHLPHWQRKKNPTRYHWPKPSGWINTSS